MSGYARWRNHRRAESGSLWQRLQAPSPVEGKLKLRRNIRYIHLNPCRAGLVADPLAWPLSTHIDAVGLVLHPVRNRRSDAARFHAHVSGDPSVRPEGTDLPLAMVDQPDLSAIADAVSMTMRAPMADLHRRGGGRTLFIGAARALTSESAAAVGAHVGMSRSAAGRVPRVAFAELRILERWIDEPRCTPLDDAVLVELLRRSRYRGAR